MSPFDMVGLIAVLVAATAILRPIMGALARRLEGNASAAPALRAELEEVKTRLGEVEAAQARLAEVEDRLDFAERLLSQRTPQAARIPGESNR